MTPKPKTKDPLDIDVDRAEFDRVLANMMRPPVPLKDAVGATAKVLRVQKMDKSLKTGRK